MFAKTTNVGFAQRVVATLVACAVLLWSLGAYSTAQAANLTNVSDTLSTSEPSVTSAHTIAFTIPTGSSLDAADNFTIAFPTTPGSGFDIGTLASGDLTVTVGGGAAAVDSFASTSVQLTLSLDTTANAGQEVVVAIPDGFITNPDTPGSGDPGTAGELVITTTSDVGKTRVAIVDTVQVTAQVLTTFDFTITGLATSTEVFTGLATTTGSTTATEIPFGTLVANTPESLAQQLNVSTNARHGYVVTVQTDGHLRSATGAIIDPFDDGVDVPNPGTAWNSPSNDVNDETTWGHWGFASNDSDLNSLGGFYTGDFSGTDYVSPTTTAREVMHHDGPSNGTTQDIGEVDVIYTIEITALQEAADDYQTTLTYIATPTF